MPRAVRCARLSSSDVARPGAAPAPVPFCRLVARGCRASRVSRDVLQAMRRGLVPRLLLDSSADVWRENAARRVLRETFFKRCGAAWCRACSWALMWTCGARAPRVARFARRSSSDAARPGDAPAPGLFCRRVARGCHSSYVSRDLQRMRRGLAPRLLLDYSVDVWREGVARRAFRETFFKRCGAAWCRACSSTLV